MTWMFLIAGLFVGVGAVLLYAAVQPAAAIIGAIFVLCAVVLCCTALIRSDLRKCYDR